MVTRGRRRGLLLVVLAFAVFAFALWQQRSEKAVAPAAVPKTAAPQAPTPEPAAAPAAPETDAQPTPSRTQSNGTLNLPAVEREQLEATLALIERNGPFPSDKDGSVFSNREKRLPIEERGYYREYTVPTPGASTRGARRVVRGRRGELWYTRDHYETFTRIDR